MKSERNCSWVLGGLFVDFTKWTIVSFFLLSFGLVFRLESGVSLGLYAIAAIGGAALALRVANKSWREKVTTDKLVLALIILLSLILGFLGTPIARTAISSFTWGYLSAFFWRSVAERRGRETRSDWRGSAETWKGALLLVTVAGTFYVSSMALDRFQRLRRYDSSAVAFGIALAVAVCLKGREMLAGREVPWQEKVTNLILLAELAVLMWAVAANLGHL